MTDQFELPQGPWTIEPGMPVIFDVWTVRGGDGVPIAVVSGEQNAKRIPAMVEEIRRLNSEEPGTPLGRLAAIAQFAKERGLCTGIEAKPAELCVMEDNDRLRALNAELGEAIKDIPRLVESIRGIPGDLSECESLDAQLCGNPWCNDFGCIANRLAHLRALIAKSEAAL